MADTPTPDVIALRDESMATMEREAQEFFDARDKERLAPQVAAKPTPAPEAKPAPVAKPEPAAAPKVGKVPGPPTAAAPKPAETPAPTTNDFSDIPKEFTPGSTRAPHWQKLHAKADHFEAQYKAVEAEKAKLSAELAQLKTGTAQPPPELQQRLTTLQQERDALEARLQAVAVEKSPRFEAAFKPRQEAAIAQAKQVVGPDKAQRIEQLLQMPESSWRDEQIDAIVQELGGGMRAAKLTQAVADLDRLAAEKAQMAQKGSELWKTWTAEEAAARDQQMQQRTTEANRVFDSELEGWKSAGLNDDDIATAKAVYSGKGTDLRDAANAAFWGVLGPKLAQAESASRQRISELEAELTKLRGVQPGVQPETGGVTAGDEEIPNEKFEDRLARLALESGLLKR